MRIKSRAVSVILSLFLVVVMLVGMTPVSAISIPNTSETTDVTSYKSEEFKVPDIIDEEEQAERAYTGRVKEEETDLYTFVFKNEDGSNTMRVFDHPVKYIDDKGETRDISLEISKDKDGTFKAVDHLIKASFGNDISEGIGLEYDDVRIEMVAKFDNSEKAKAGLSDDGKKLTYAVDDKTSYVYSLTYCGIKEDIVVSEYTGQTEYEFTLDTNGLHPVKIDDSVFLADNDEEIKASIGDIIIFTADNRNNAFGDLQFETVEENGEYKFTIVLDPDYLKDEKTAYPITIDPTIEINYDNNGAGAIEDVTINSLDTSSGSSGSIYVGLRNTYGIARILMRFPNLDLSGIALADNITSATVEMKDLLCETESMTVYCYIFNGNSWSESNVDWQTVSPNSYTTFLSSKTVSYSIGNSLNPLHRYSFNILAAVKGWKNDTADQSKGIIFKASNSIESGNTYINKTFASYNRATNKPSLSITYNGHVTVSVDATYLLVGGTRQVNCTTYPTGLTVTWSSNNSSVATVNNTGLVTGVSEGTVKITATYTDSATGNSSSDYVYLYVKDSLGIKDDTTYYVMNYDSHRHMSLETASDANLTNVFTRARSTSDLSKWRVEKQSDSTFQLVSIYSSAGRVLDITGTNVDIYTNNNANCEKFAVYRINSGTYRGLYYIRYGKYYVTQDTDYNVYITTTASSKAVWSFMAVEKEDADLFSFQFTGFNTTANNSLFDTTMTGLGYDAYTWINDTPSNAYNYMKNTDDVFIFRGHGGAGIIEFYDSSGVSTGAISVNSAVCSSYLVGSDRKYIESLDKNELEQLRVVLYIGCSTGKTITVGGMTYDLLLSTYNKGAQFVLGTSQTVYTPDSNAFLKGFLNKLNDNNNPNVIDCIQAGLDSAGNNVLYEDGSRGHYPIVYIGDTIQYLNY